MGEDNPNQFYLGSVWVRSPERYGDVALSVQASDHHDCSPKINGLPIDAYESVEVALRNADGQFISPKDVGIEGFDHLFWKEGEIVYPASWVSQERLKGLRKALRERAGL